MTVRLGRYWSILSWSDCQINLIHKLKFCISCRNFSKFWSQQWNYKYGNCFTFNGGSDKDKQPLRVLKATKPGPTHGKVKYVTKLISKISENDVYIRSCIFNQILSGKILFSDSNFLGYMIAPLPSLPPRPVLQSYCGTFLRSLRRITTKLSKTDRAIHFKVSCCILMWNRINTSDRSRSRRVFECCCTNRDPWFSLLKKVSVCLLGFQRQLGLERWGRHLNYNFLPWANYAITYYVIKFCIFFSDTNFQAGQIQ